MEVTTAIPSHCDLTTLGAIADAFEVLQTLIDQPFPGATATQVVKLRHWARDHYVKYIEARAQEAMTHGEKIAEGKFNIPVENQAAYNQAMAPIRAQAVEIETSIKIAVTDLAQATISAAALEVLSPFLTGLN